MRSSFKLAIAGAGIAAAIAMFGLTAETPLPKGAASAAPMVDVTVPPLDAQAQQGADLFAARCAICHGDHASGRQGLGPPLIHKIYEPGHHADMSIILAVRRGVTAHHWRFGNMPPQPGISDAQIAGLVTYLRTLQRANGIY